MTNCLTRQGGPMMFRIAQESVMLMQQALERSGLPFGPRFFFTRCLLMVSFIALMLSSLANPQRAMAADATAVAIPALALWESNMVTYGQKHCQYFASSLGTFDERLAATYYDAEGVFWRINIYTQDPSWKYCAQLAEAIYRDQYVFPNNGTVPGYWDFTHGLAIDYTRMSDAKSHDAVVLLSQNASYCPDSTPLDWLVDASRSRETAYCIMSYLNAESVGEPRRSRLASLVTIALGHLDQWFVTKTTTYLQPFMVGLTMKALIQFNETTPDSRIPPAIATALDQLWSRAWISTAQAFYYESTNPTGAAPDLNLLIAPAYAWMHLRTGNTIYRDRGDQIFASGVSQAYLDGPKQFNQSYFWSFDYVYWRLLANSTTSTTTTSTTSTTTTTPTASTSTSSTSTTTTPTASTSTSSTSTPTTTSTSSTTTSTSTPSTSTSTTSTNSKPDKSNVGPMGKALGYFRNLNLW